MTTATPPKGPTEPKQPPLFGAYANGAGFMGPSLTDVLEEGASETQKARPSWEYVDDDDEPFDAYSESMMRLAENSYPYGEHAVVGYDRQTGRELWADSAPTHCAWIEWGKYAICQGCGAVRLPTISIFRAPQINRQREAAASMVLF